MAAHHSNDYFRLFVKREGKVVLGRHGSNLWIMTAVLFLAFLALAFGNAGTKYLALKMNDPFIKWQNIENKRAGHSFNDLVSELSQESVQSRFHFCNVNEDYVLGLEICEKGSWGTHLRYCRLYSEMDTELMRTVLDPSNVINSPAYDLDGLKDALLGVVVTEQMLRILGYENTLPPYLYMAYGLETGYKGETGSLQYRDDLQIIKIPIPVIGVVKRLPGNLPFSASVVLKGNYTGALNIASEENINISNSLLYFVDERIDESAFTSMLASLCEEQGFTNPEIYSPYIPELMPFAKGKLLEVDQAWRMGCEAVTAINNAISSAFPDDKVVRVFNYQITGENLALPQFASYLTVEFEDLDRLPQFVDYVSDFTNGAVELDITQTNVKENLNMIQMLANVLSLALVLFAIACIVLFIVNLLQSYFQRVKKNLGTFKAFGISNHELLKVYLFIILASVAFALVVALLAVMVLQWILPVREPGCPYLSLWCPLTAVSVAVVFAASVLTVYLVMSRLLKATPGDLIYDRQ